MRRPPIVYLASALAFAALDAVWLGVVAADFYRGEIGSLMLATPRWVPAILFYLMYVAMVVGFVIAPSAGQAGVGRVLMRGAAFGLACYGTYDLTNLATLTAWTTRMAIVDTLWGMSATAIAAAVGHRVARRTGSVSA